MANIYDIAYAMEREIRSCNDYKNTLDMLTKLNENADEKALFMKFRNAQHKMQSDHVAGKTISEELQKEFDEIVNEVQASEQLTKLLMTEERLFLLINDLTKIILKPLEDLK